MKESGLSQALAKRALIRKDLGDARLTVPAFFHTFLSPIPRPRSPGLTHLPVILDPAHSSGRRDLIPTLARACVSVGADGMMVETHPDPESAWSDGPQSLTFEGFAEMMKNLKPYIELWKTERAGVAAAV